MFIFIQFVHVVLELLLFYGHFWVMKAFKYFLDLTAFSYAKVLEIFFEFTFKRTFKIKAILVKSVILDAYEYVICF